MRCRDGILRAQRIEQVRREVGQVVRFGGQRFAQGQIEIERREVARLRAGAAAGSRVWTAAVRGCAPGAPAQGCSAARPASPLRPTRGCADRGRNSATRRLQGRRHCRRTAHAPRTSRGSRPCRRRPRCASASSASPSLLERLALLAAARQSRELHGERAAATHHAAGAQVEAHGSRDRQAIDAGVAARSACLRTPAAHGGISAAPCRAAESATGRRWRCAR